MCNSTNNTDFNNFLATPEGKECRGVKSTNGGNNAFECNACPKYSKLNNGVCEFPTQLNSEFETSGHIEENCELNLYNGSCGSCAFGSIRFKTHKDFAPHYSCKALLKSQLDIAGCDLMDVNALNSGSRECQRCRSTYYQDDLATTKMCKPDPLLYAEFTQVDNNGKRKALSCNGKAFMVDTDNSGCEPRAVLFERTVNDIRMEDKTEGDYDITSHFTEFDHDGVLENDYIITVRQESVDSCLKLKAFRLFECLTNNGTDPQGQQLDQQLNILYQDRYNAIQAMPEVDRPAAMETLELFTQTNETVKKQSLAWENMRLNNVDFCTRFEPLDVSP